jgi:hypothetical protein
MVEASTGQYSTKFPTHAIIIIEHRQLGEYAALVPLHRPKHIF